MQRQPARGLLIDLDGVIRLWDPEAAVAAEAKYGLEPGVLLRTAMTWDIYRAAMAGEITDAEWMQLIAMRLPLPTEDAAAAVAQWQTHRGAVDAEVLVRDAGQRRYRLLRRVRTDGRGVLTLRTGHRAGRRYRLRWQGFQGAPVRAYLRRQLR